MACLFTGCSIGSSEGEDESTESVDKDAFAEIQEMLKNLESYETDASIEYISNKNTVVIDTHQQAKITGEYRIEVVGPKEVAGTITINDNENIYQYNYNISDKVYMTNEDKQTRSEIFLTSFIKNYFSDESASVSVASMDESNTTVLEAQIPGDNPYLQKQRLYVDNETLEPIQMSIYNQEDEVIINITYENFEYNPPLDDSVFEVEG